MRRVTTVRHPLMHCAQQIGSLGWDGRLGH
jgi:hypothetical protein